MYVATDYCDATLMMAVCVAGVVIRTLTRAVPVGGVVKRTLALVVWPVWLYVH